MGYIYRIINKINGKIYIGQTINKKERVKDYKFFRSQLKRQPKIYNAINKYGWDNFLIEIIEECERDLLNIKERYWQEYYCSVENGYNCYYTSTNEKPLVVSEESREKLRQHRTGKKHTIETKLKIGKRRSIKIYQYNLQGQFIQQWNSIVSAQTSLNIRGISYAMTTNGFAGGFLWSKEKYNSVPAKRKGQRDRIKIKIINMSNNKETCFDSLTAAEPFVKTNRQRIKRYINTNKILNGFKIYSH